MNEEPKPPSLTAAFRTQQALLAEKENRDRITAERGSIDAAFAKLAADMSADEMAALCESVTNLDKNLRGSEFQRRLLKRGPEKSRLLRILVVEHVRKGRAA